MRILSQVSISIFGLLSIFLLYNSSTSISPEPVGKSLAEDAGNRLPQIIKSIKLDKQYSFAGEPLPKENFDALERLDRELLVNSYWHSSTILNLKKVQL